MPAMPPRVASAAASARKRACTWPRVAPSARTRPISLVRSPTAIHIMVRIPVAPTRSEMPAMAPTAMVTTSITLPKTSSMASWEVTVKSSVPPWRTARTRRTSASTRAASRALE